MSNRYNTTKQSLPIAAWIIGICVAGCIVGFGVRFLMVKFSVHQGGTDIKKMELRLAQLNTNNEHLRSTIDKLTAHDELKKKRAVGFIKLRDISDERDVIHERRNDKRVAWKDGVSYIASREITPDKKSVAEAGGNR